LAIRWVLSSFAFVGSGVNALGVVIEARDHVVLGSVVTLEMADRKPDISVVDLEGIWGVCLVLVHLEFKSLGIEILLLFLLV